MISFAQRRLSPITLAVVMAFAVLGSVLVPANKASASCGDYLHSDEAVLFEASPFKASPFEATAPADDQGPTSCKGPNCSGHSMTLSLPVIPAEKTLSDLLISWFDSRDPQYWALSLTRVPAVSMMHSVGVHAILYRPPIAS